MEHIQRLAIIGLINILVYWKTIYYGYVGDDVERSERATVFKNKYHRWWVQFIGMKHTNSMVAHLLTLLSHTACCMMIYLCLGRNNVAFLASLLFSINPVNIQGSVWISGRNYAISSILCLSMFLIPQLSWVGYMLTSHFAVNAWFAPLAFLGTKYWYCVFIIPLIWLGTRTNRETINRKLWETAGLKTTNTEMRAIKVKKIIPFVKTYLYYFSLAVFPWNIGVEHSFLRGFGTNKTDNQKGYKLDWLFYVGALLFFGISGLSTYCIFKGWIPFVWGLFWFTINISMWCNFVTYQQQIAERYIYLANIGMMYAIACLIINYPLLITIFFTAYFIRLWYVMDMYLNDWWAVEYTIREQKKMHYMWLMRGVKKFLNKDYMGSIYDFTEAHTHKPYDLKILYNLSSNYFILGDIVKAREFLEKAKKNVYDELDEAVKPAFAQLEALIVQVEEARGRGENTCQVDLSKLIVVK